MKILAHRGCWKKPKEKNTYQAIKRAIKNDFGIEIDIRDYKNKLVVSHDIPKDNSLFLEDIHHLFILSKGLIVLNIKSDGLLPLLKKHKLFLYNYAIFDMSTPELIQYSKTDIPLLTRISEYEKNPILIKKARGIWADFYNPFNFFDWHMPTNKTVCIVSPELHNNSKNKFWQQLKKINHINLYLCTDYPTQARRFFND